MTTAFQFLRLAWNRLDTRMIGLMTTCGIRFMRISLAVIFIWFGLLKVIGQSPVADLVAQTVYWVSPDIFIPFLGLWETVVGLGLLFGTALRLTLFLFWLQMAGTFLVLILRRTSRFNTVTRCS